MKNQKYDQSKRGAKTMAKESRIFEIQKIEES